MFAARPAKQQNTQQQQQQQEQQQQLWGSDLAGPLITMDGNSLLSKVLFLGYCPFLSILIKQIYFLTKFMQSQEEHKEKRKGIINVALLN